MDWGLFRCWNESGYYGLRSSKLCRFQPKFYYFAMITNILLRFYWIISLFPNLVSNQIVKNLDIILFSSILAEAFRRT